MTTKKKKLDVFARDDIASGVTPAPKRVPFDLWQRIQFNAGIDSGIYSATGPVTKALASSKPLKKKPRTLFADTGDSECFDYLAYKDGTVTAVFTDGSLYEYDMEKADAQDWFSDDLGRYFNAVIRPNY